MDERFVWYLHSTFKMEEAFVWYLDSFMRMEEAFVGYLRCLLKIGRSFSRFEGNFGEADCSWEWEEFVFVRHLSGFNLRR